MTILRARPYLFLGLGLLLVAGALLAANLASSVAVQVHIDSQTHTLNTRAATVGQALNDAGFWLDPSDSVQPPLDAPIQAGMDIHVQRAPLVSLDINGQARWLRSGASSAAGILAALDLSQGPEDLTLLDGQPADAAALSSAPRHLELLPAADLTIYDSGAPPRTVRVAARTLGQALWNLGYRLYLEDEVQPPLDTPLTPGLSVTLRRSQPVLVQADGQSILTRSLSASVGDALRDAGVVLVGEDYSQPPESEPVPSTGIISVMRVQQEVLTEQQLIPYETVYQPLPEAEIDTQQLVQAGAPGVLRRLTRVRYENGVEVSRVTEAEALVQAPRNHIVGYGTAIVIRTLATPDGVIEYWRSYTMYATSYAARFTGRDPASPNYGRTASGKIVTRGLVAIDRRMMPFGTRMYVPGYGFAEAADTGGGVRGRFIDLGFDDHNYVSWSRVVTVYFLTPVPPAGTIRWIIPSTVP